MVFLNITNQLEEEEEKTERHKQVLPSYKEIRLSTLSARGYDRHEISHIYPVVFIVHKYIICSSRTCRMLHSFYA